MADRFLKFLFETSQEEADAEAILEELSYIDDLKTAAKPLLTALRSLKVSTEDTGLVYSDEGVAVEISEVQDYHDALTLLNTPEAMTKLAEMGWVAAPSGEQQANGPLRIYFLRINDTTGDGTENSDDVPDLDALIGKARKEGDEPTSQQAKERKVEEAKNHMGERSFATYEAWRAAVKKIKPDVKFDGDKDICNAPGVGEWDGETGCIYKKKTESVEESAKILADRLLNEEK